MSPQSLFSMSLILFGMEAYCQIPMRGSSGDSSYCQDLKPITKSLLAGSLLGKSDKIELTGFKEDSRYGLPLSPFWTLLKACLQVGGNAKYEIRSRDLPAPDRLRLWGAAARNGSLSGGEGWRMKGLALAGRVSIERYPRFLVSLRVEILDANGSRVDAVDIPDLKPFESEDRMDAEFFPRLYGPKAMALAEIHQRTVERVDKALVGSGRPPVLPGFRFAFRNGSEAVEARVTEELKRALIGHFGFLLDASAKDSLVLTDDCALSFRFRSGAIFAADSVIEPPPMIDRFRAWDVKGFTVLLDPTTAGSEAGAPRPAMQVAFAQVSDRFPDLGRTIAREIDSNFAQAYGRNAGRPDFAYLRKVFQGKETRILKGRLVNPGSAVDTIAYSWATADVYLKSLEQRVQRGQRFDVGMTLLRLYQDKPNSGRFWGIVSQDWTTRTVGGGPAYRDDGILFVNFDLDPGSGTLQAFRIYYRFWFYKYKHDIWRKVPGQAPIRVSRKQRMAEAISAALDHEAALPPEIRFGRFEESANRFIPDSSDRGIAGVDMDLLRRMRDDLVEVMQ